MAEINPIAVYEPLPWQVEPLLCTDSVMLLTGSAGGGKALALDTEIPTVKGCRTMGELKVGDFVLDSRGEPTQVIAATEVMLNRSCLKIVFSTEDEVVCDVEHLWRVSHGEKESSLVLSSQALAVKNVAKLFHIQHHTGSKINFEKIVSTESVPVRCIQVAAKDGCYQITRSFIPTHNSKVAAEKVHLFLQKYPNSMGLVVRKQRNSMTNSTVLFLEVSVIGDDPNVRHFPSKNRFEYMNGSILAYGGMDGEEQKQQIRSIGQEGSLHIVWMEEANSFNEDDFNEILARMRGRGTPWRQIILSTNPDSPTHWIYNRLISGQEATVFYSHAEQNKHNADDYVATLKKLTGVARLRLTEGRWVQASGVIYDTFSLDVHRIKPFPIPKDWSRILAIDFGYVHPFVCLFGAVDPDGRIYIYKEIHHTKRTVSTHLKTILAEIEKDGVDIDVVVCDHDAEDRMTLNEGGLPNIPADKDVARGLQVVMDRLVIQGDGKPRVMIFENSLVEVDPELVEKKKPLCLVDEFPGYVWAVTQGTQNPKEAPLKVNDDSCLVAGTLITTESGQVPIEGVTVGMKVLTRTGYKTVIGCGLTNASASTYTVVLSNGKTLRGTGNHPVCANGDFVRLDSLRYYDILTTADQNSHCAGVLVCQNERTSLLSRLSTKGLYFVGIQNRPVGLLPTILRQIVFRDIRRWVVCIKRFGETTLVKFRKGVTSITKMETPVITIQVILNWLQLKSMVKEPKLCLVQNGWNAYATKQNMLDRLQKRGMDQKKGWSGTGKMAKTLGKTYQSVKRFVSVVKSRIQQEQVTNEIVFVQTNVKPKRATCPVLTTKHEFVSTVEKSLSLISIQKLNPVPLSVVSVIADHKKQPVYNLTVSGESPEYYANGILVHNCDTLRYMCVFVDSAELSGMSYAPI